MDQLRKGIHLRGYAQKDPQQEYKRESFDLFQMMLGAIKSDTVQDLSRVHIPTKEELEAMEAERLAQAERQRLMFEHDDLDSLTGEGQNEAEVASLNQAQQPNRQMAAQSATDGENPYEGMNISRNAPCPCGSGLRYKQCHGKI